MKVVILAGGLGSRLSEETHLRPKPMVDIGGRHVCLGDGRLYVHDGHATQDILEGRNADVLFESIDSTFYESTFLAHNVSKSEVWICYPTSTVFCNEALIWNYKTDTFFTRQIPDLRHATTGLITSGTSTAWSGGTGTAWSALTGSWGKRLYSPIGDTFIGAGEKILQFESGNLEDTATMDCYSQRNNFNLGDEDDWHMITAVYPRAAGDAFQIRVGSQAYIDAPIAWEDAQTFTPGTDDKVDIRSSGPFHAVQFRSTADVSWSVSGYTIHFEKEGQR